MRTLLGLILVGLIPLSYGDQYEGKIKDLVENKGTGAVRDGSTLIIVHSSFVSPGSHCDQSCMSKRMEWVESNGPNPFIEARQNAESSDIKDKQEEDE